MEQFYNNGNLEIIKKLDTTIYDHAEKENLVKKTFFFYGEALKSEFEEFLTHRGKDFRDRTL